MRNKRPILNDFLLIIHYKNRILICWINNLSHEKRNIVFQILYDKEKWSVDVQHDWGRATVSYIYLKTSNCSCFRAFLVNFNLSRVNNIRDKYWLCCDPRQICRVSSKDIRNTK